MCSIQLVVAVGNTESESLSKLMKKVIANVFIEAIPLASTVPYRHTVVERNGKALNSHFFDEEILFQDYCDLRCD